MRSKQNKQNPTSLRLSIFPNLRTELLPVYAILLVILAACSTDSTLSSNNRTVQANNGQATPIAITLTYTPEPTYTRTQTLTATVTSTATPAPVELIGNLFFDLNGDGNMGLASLICDPDFFNPESFLGRPEFLATVLEQASDCIEGNIITINEPPLWQYLEVCLGDTCVTPTRDGTYHLIGYSTSNNRVRINNTTTDPILMMHYLMIGETQKSIRASCSSGSIGLIQGSSVLPIRAGDFSTIDMVQGFDHNNNPNRYQVLGYNGQTNPCPDYDNCLPENDLDWPPLDGIGPNHGGIDFGCISNSNCLGIPLVATEPGYYYFRLRSGGWVGVLLPEPIDRELSGDFMTTNGIEYQHLSGELPNEISDGAFVARGTVIAYLGQSVAVWPHLHLNLYYPPSYENNGLPNPYSKDFFAFTNEENWVPGINDTNRWTAYNVPIFPPEH